MPAVTLCAALALFAAARISASAGLSSGVLGVVLNTTCPGPCSLLPKPWPRYEGNNLVVVIRHLPDRELVVRLRPTDGRFGAELVPGAYRIRAAIVPRDAQRCWEGETKKILVGDGVFTRVRLHVNNACVL
jgi:hypothetical protein